MKVLENGRPHSNLLGPAKHERGARLSPAASDGSLRTPLGWN